MEGHRRKPRRNDNRREVWKVQGRSRRKDGIKGKASAKKHKVKSEKHLETYGGLSEGIEMKTYLHVPIDFAKTLRIRFRVGDLDLPEKIKRHTSSREEEEVDAQMCPCGKAIESRTHMVGESEMYREERDVSEEEKRERDECGMEEFGTLVIDSSEKTTAILGGDRWWPQTAEQGGYKISKTFLCNIWEQRTERATVGSVSIRSIGTVLRLERDAWSMVK